MFNLEVSEVSSVSPTQSKRADPSPADLPPNPGYGLQQRGSTDIPSLQPISALGMRGTDFGLSMIFLCIGILCTFSVVPSEMNNAPLSSRMCVPGGGGGGEGALGYLGGCIRSLSKLKNTPKALISGQKNTLILIKR